MWEVSDPQASPGSTLSICPFKPAAAATTTCVCQTSLLVTVDARGCMGNGGRLPPDPAATGRVTCYSVQVWGVRHL